jgi:hypothetical protein
LDEITGVDELRTTGNKLLIYANPNKGKCNIVVPDDFSFESKLTLMIFDNKGKLIQQKVLQMDGDKILVNLEQEAKGIYNVVLSGKNKNYSGKIVFE